MIILKSSFRTLVFITGLAYAGLAAAQNSLPFRLNAKIHRIDQFPNVSAKLYYVFERTKTNGQLNQPVTDILPLANTDRNRFLQFDTSKSNLRFPTGVTRGFVYGHIFDETDLTNPIAYVPITQFSASEMNDRRIISHDIRALVSSRDAFKKSYPIDAYHSNPVSDENADFILLILIKMIEDKFVNSDEDWQTLYTFFQTHIDYFANGASDQTNRILTFLDRQYTNYLARGDRGDNFSKHYSSFLVDFLGREIGDRIGPDGRNVHEYALAKFKDVQTQEVDRILVETTRALREAYERPSHDMCFKLSMSTLNALQIRENWIYSIKDNPTIVSNLKVIMKRVVDCAQLNYWQSHRDDGASIDNLAQGVREFSTGTQDEQGLLRSFANLYHILDGLGLLPQRERGNLRQVYDYYNEILTLTEGAN